MAIERTQLNELLYQALETEMGGVKVYQSAIQCAINKDLKKEWNEYLEQTRQHVRVLLDVCEKFRIDPEAESPGRQVVRNIGESLVSAMTMALQSDAPREVAQLVAAECVVNAETKDHLNWELIGKVGSELSGEEADALKDAYDQIEDEEDEHLYHTKGWTRELWIASLGMPAVLPPPEEVKDVETAIGAAKAEASRDTMLRKRPARR
jgi:hypothetical protein